MWGHDDVGGVKGGTNADGRTEATNDVLTRGPGDGGVGAEGARRRSSGLIEDAQHALFLGFGQRAKGTDATRIHQGHAGLVEHHLRGDNDATRTQLHHNVRLGPVAVAEQHADQSTVAELVTQLRGDKRIALGAPHTQMGTDA